MPTGPRPVDVDVVGDPVAPEAGRGRPGDLVGVVVAEPREARQPALVVERQLGPRVDGDRPLGPQPEVAVDELRAVQLEEARVLDAAADVGRHLDRRERAPAERQGIAARRQLRVDRGPVVRVVVDARPPGDEPRVRHAQLLLHEVRVVLHPLQVVEGVGLAVVVVARAQHLAVEPRRIELVAHRRPPQPRPVLEGVVEAAVRSAPCEEPAGAEAGRVSDEPVERRLVEQTHEPGPGRI